MAAWGSRACEGPSSGVGEGDLAAAAAGLRAIERAYEDETERGAVVEADRAGGGAMRRRDADRRGRQT